MTEIIGTAEHYGQFVNLLRARIDELGITYNTVGEMCGFSEGYTNAIFCGTKAMSVYSLFTLSKALALDVYFYHDEDDLARLQKRADWIKLRRTGPRYRGERGGVIHFNNNLNFYRKIQRLATKSRNARASEKRAISKMKRKAALARWNKPETQNGG